MKKRFLPIVWFLIIILSASSCFALSEAQKQEYGALKTAVILSKAVVKGEYGHALPREFDREVFMEVIEDRIPDKSYQALEKYPIQVIPKEGYYLLLVYDPRDNSLILFDYSCSLGVQGRILEEPNRYDVNNLQLYDTCKKRE